MHRVICSNCGYQKNRSPYWEHILTTPVYPFYNATIIAPQLAKDYISKDLEACPYCGKTEIWKNVFSVQNIRN